MFRNMKRALFMLFLVSWVFPAPSLAFNYAGEFFASSHEAPAWFEIDNQGGFYGETTSGTVFTQKPINNNVSLRLHKFVIGPAYFYISDKGIIRAENDLSAISIYFTLA